MNGNDLIRHNASAFIHRTIKSSARNPWVWLLPSEGLLIHQDGDCDCSYVWRRLTVEWVVFGWILCDPPVILSCSGTSRIVSHFRCLEWPLSLVRGIMKTLVARNNVACGQLFLCSVSLEFQHQEACTLFRKLFVSLPKKPIKIVPSTGIINLCDFFSILCNLTFLTRHSFCSMLNFKND